MKVKIQPINSKEAYEKALDLIDSLWNAKPKTEEGDTLDILVTLVEAYENRHSLNVVLVRVTTP